MRKLKSHDGLVMALALCGWFALPSSVLAKPALESLHSFCVGAGCLDGSTPSTALVKGPDGYLYGTTTSGGAGNRGTIYKISPTGTLTTLHSFCTQAACLDGVAPYARLLLGLDGNFYGTTSLGNPNFGFFPSLGTIFQLTPAGVLTTLYTFCPQTVQCIDGSNPSALVQGADGNLYGTTSGGSGATAEGSIFRITPAGVLTTLYSFCSQSNCVDGSDPPDGLTLANDGNFYGTTVAGGTNGKGTVYKVTPQGALTVLYNFCSQPSCADGDMPLAGLIQASDGGLYGTTSAGGASAHDSALPGSGTVFKITTAGALTTLYSFCSPMNCSENGIVSKDGSYPQGRLIQGSDGNLYGTTASGGTGFYGGAYTVEGGTVFQIAPSGTLRTLYSFCTASNCPDGAWPTGGLIEASDGRFCGATAYGGANQPTGGIYASGAIFCLVASGSGADSTALGALADYLDEGKAGFTVWRPSTGYWYSIDGAGGSAAGQWGAPTDLPVFGDFDGDGKSDLAVFRPATGSWYITRSSDQQLEVAQWGVATDLPVAGDFDGDGKTDLAVFRPATGYWYITQSSDNSVVAKQWGIATDVPVVGDFDGDGKTDVAVFRPSTGYWYITLSSSNTVVAQQWGLATDIPVTGDFDGDGKTDIAVFRPSNGYWYIIQSSDGQVVQQQWGQAGDVPVAGDYDGDGKTDIAVWRPSIGYWYVILSSSSQTLAQQWGVATDVPINSVQR